MLLLLLAFTPYIGAGQSLSLQKGDSIVITIKATKRFTQSGIMVGKGEIYHITATGQWRDAGFEPTDAGGFPSKNGAMRFARFLKPMPGENYMKFVVKAGGRHYAVGDAASIRVRKKGKLVLQPNDALFFFGNNSGTQMVTIKRLD